MYVPGEDWPGVRRATAAAFKSDGVVCGSQYCFFENRCEWLDGGSLRQKTLTIALISEVAPHGTVRLEIGGDKLFIPGEHVGLSSDRCVLGVFKQADARQDAWYLGNLILGDYYLVFDMTPLTEHNRDFIQVGFAPMNPAGLRYQEYPPAPPAPEPKPEPVDPIP